MCIRDRSNTMMVDACQTWRLSDAIIEVDMTSAIPRRESALPASLKKLQPLIQPFSLRTSKGKQEGPPLPVINNFK